jgi:hypothetical protein
MANPKMTQTARLERLEKKVQRLEQRMARVAHDPEEERVRARTLVLEHLRKHKSIDGWKFAAKHGLVWNDVEEALDELEKMGSVERVDDE